MNVGRKGSQMLESGRERCGQFSKHWLYVASWCAVVMPTLGGGSRGGVGWKYIDSLLLTVE